MAKNILKWAVAVAAVSAAGCGPLTPASHSWVSTKTSTPDHLTQASADAPIGPGDFDRPGEIVLPSDD